MHSAAPTPATVPEPTVAASFRHGGRAFLSELPLLLILGLLTGAVQWGAWALHGGRGVLALVGVVVAVLVAIPLKWGFYYLCLRVVRGEPAEGRDLLRPFERYRDAAVAAFAVLFAVVLGLFLLVVPGIVLWCRLAFVPYLLTDERMSAENAIRESWRLTRGRAWTIFGIGLVGCLVSLLGLMAAGIGILPAMIWWDLAMASYYHAEVEPSWETDFDADERHLRMA